MSDYPTTPIPPTTPPPSEPPSELGSEQPTQQLWETPGDPTPPPPPPSYPGDGPRRRGGTRRTAALVLATALVAGGAGGAIGAWAVPDGGSTTVVQGSANNSSVSDVPVSVPSGSATAVAAKILPSVVSIQVRTGQGGDTGSGVILSSDGDILTNNHVVEAATNGGGDVKVFFNDGSSAPAKILGTDAESDLAVIKVDKTGLPAAELGDSEKVAVGQQVLAVGSPLGLSGTVTQGIVSALHRPVDTTQAQDNSPFGGQQQQSPTVIDAIQTDAPINPGNSGGALVDMNGRVIGINSAIATLGASLGGQSGSIGVGFAIPINQAKSIADQLIAHGKATHPLIGIGVSDASDGSGALVAQVNPGSPGAKAGIQKGDVVTAVDGRRIGSADALIAAVREHQPGETITLKVQRGGSTHTVQVTLTQAGTTQS